MSPTATATMTNGYAASIPPSAMPLISPSALLHAHLAQNPPTRPSNRLPTECRQISLNASSLTHANGSALVRIGDTAVVCGVRAEILSIHDIANYRVRRPENEAAKSKKTLEEDMEEDEYAEIPTNALLVPNIELATGCSPSHLPGGPPSIEAQSISQRLLSLLHTSRIVRPSDLRIFYTPPIEADEEERAKGPQLKAYWALYIDILCVSYGGAIFDAAWLALYAALRDTLLPRAWWDGDTRTVLCSPDVRLGRKLDLRGSPVPLTFCVFIPESHTSKTKSIVSDDRMWVLCDSDAFEEECCEEKGCVVVDWSGEIVKLEKSGGGKAGIAQIKALVTAAGKRWQMWDAVLKASGEPEERPRGGIGIGGVSGIGSGSGGERFEDWKGKRGMGKWEARRE